jgi:hypothetical protein
MVIHVKNLAGGADTQDQGTALLKAVRDAIASKGEAIVSFDGVDIATSSFVNASFIALLSDIDVGEMKKRVRVVRASRQIGDMIRTRVERESRLMAA